MLPCEGEDSVKWSFINSLKEVSYVISSVYAHVYDGTCLIYNMMSHACSTFQRRCLCTELYAFTGICLYESLYTSHLSLLHGLLV